MFYIIYFSGFFSGPGPGIERTNEVQLLLEKYLGWETERCCYISR